MSQPGQCGALQQQWQQRQQQQPHIVKCDLHLRQSSQSVTQSLAIPLIYSLARRWLVARWWVEILVAVAKQSESAVQQTPYTEMSCYVCCMSSPNCGSA